MPSKLDLVLFAATAAALVGFIERGHSIVIDPPEAIELAKPTSPQSCADDEDARYGLGRLVWLEEGYVTAPRPRHQSASARSPACDR
jgi:hypothetical protein